MLYRMSIDASLCFDVVAASEEEAMEKATAALADDIPECLELGGLRHICVYPGNDNENLEVQSLWEVQDGLDDELATKDTPA